MSSLRSSLLSLLRLIRIELVFASISNVWVIVFLSRAIEPLAYRNPAFDQLGLPMVLLLAAVLAGGLHVYAMVLNDVLDLRHDRVFNPHRPIAAGRVSLATSLVAAMLGLIVAVFAAVFLGTGAVFLTLLAAAGVVFFNTFGKYLPAVGITALGLIRVASMFAPNPRLGYAWPIWLAMTHTMGAAAVAHRLRGKRPRLHAGGWWWLCAGWAFWTMALVFWIRYREQLEPTDYPVLWLGPIIAGLAFLGFVAVQWPRLRSPIRHRQHVGARFARLAMHWLILYDVGWLISAGLFGPSLLHLSLFAAALGVSRLLYRHHEIEPAA
jgi:4-hydroxybenzoate polyprenyltransferase